MSTSTAKKARKRRGVAPDVEQMKRDYLQGRMSIRGVAQKHDVSYGKAHDMLREAGVALRQRGVANPFTADGNDTTEGEA